jgi:DNA-binding XRE family transcriptional regulator
VETTDRAQPAVVAHRWGVLVRRARLRSGRTQAEIGRDVGLSQPTISRMELGRGDCFPLASWVAVANATGVVLSAGPEPTPPFGVDAVAAIAASGRWTVAAKTPFLVIEREPRSIQRFGRAHATPGERAVALVTDVVTDVDAVVAELLDALGRARVSTPVGWATGAVLIVRQSPSNRRRLTAADDRLSTWFPRLGGGWLRALEDLAAPMPARLGALWLTDRATHLVPMGLLPRAR